MKVKILSCMLLIWSVSMFSNTILNSSKYDNTLNKSIVNKVENGECKINIYTKLDNGTVIEGTITIIADEMNFLKCWGFKLYGLFSSDF
jgi:hypothetical protein